MKIYDYNEVDALSREWIDCLEGLPPAGKEVIVETKKGVITALARFDRFEDSMPCEGWWDNAYPGKGNTYLYTSVIAWRPMPKGTAKGGNNEIS